MMDKQSRPPSVSSEVDDLDSTTSTKSRHASEAQSEPDAVESTRNDFKDEPKLDDIKRLESIIQSLRDTTAAQISQLRDMVTQKDKIISDLTDKLEQQRDYEEIKRELCIFRSELSHFPPVISSLEQGSDSKAFQSYLLEKSKTFPHEPLKLESEAAGAPGQSLAAVQRNAFFNPFSLPQLQSLGNVESFGTMLGEELVSSYAKALAKRDPSIFAMAAAAAASSTNGSKLNATNNQNNGNLTDSLSPSHGSNGEEAVEDKSGGSASTTPTSAMICPEGADPVNHSPLGATTVSDLGLSSFSPSPQNTTTASYDKLQQQLRYNVEKYMNENLNTLQISRYVRELLSVHNIGQRLFAKYVLGLSQGTVSELLSKPKPWDKLTEKGRDSYRKMHAWSSDERCIHLLKSLVPRKGKDTSTYKQEDPVSEERIVQILNEAQRSMHSKGISRTDFFTTPFLNGEHLQSRIERDLKASSTIENASDNGSDPDENKSDLAGNERKSPGSALNATAMATINNFYRNINESFPGDSRNRLVRPKFGGQESDEANQSDMMRIYQDHITKMIGQQLEEGLRNTHNYEDIRNVMALQQELLRANPFAVQANPELLARLFSSGLINGAGYLGNLPLGMDLPQANQMDSLRKVAQSDTQLGKEVRELNSSASEPRLKIDNLLSQLKSGGSLSPSRNGTPPAPVVSVSASMPGAPGVAFSNASETPDDLVASPLQRMQSITNSLLSQSSLPSLPSQPSRPAKAVLPPITQQQFDQYNNLNTEEIVKRVKEQLSQYSISQRLFGESVLGLSQGSVSDLLARPKPWHVLTQKGREPFIRMKMFLEDENAIHKLVASQYKIAPEKLMRTGSFVSGTGISSIAMAPTVPPQISTPPSNLSLNSLNSPVCNKNVNTHLKLTNENVYKYEQSMSPSSVDNGTRSNTSSPELNVSNPSSVPSPLLSSRSRIGGYSSINNNLLRPALNQTSAYMQPSVYELAALTSDLDTQTITTRIKETLMAHNIGQKIFGEVVLGLSQGSVSELLSKPKPWHMLSIKGREPFIRMQLWLNDPNNIEKLQTLKNERREANKRRRTHMEETLPGMKSFDNQLFNFSGNFNLGNSLNKGLLGSAGAFVGSTTGTQQPVVKKARILFTEEQKEALRIAFSMDPYPSSSTAEFLAKELNLSIRTITNWFHNHRMRLKQTSAATGEDNQTNLPYNIGRDNVSFDQNKFRSLLSQRISELKLRSNNLPHSNNSSSGSTSSHNDNSNPSYGHSFSQSSASSPPHFQQRLKYSPSMFHSQGIYSNNTNSCSSPGSSSPFQEDEEMGTLDLSMSSHNQHRLEDKLDSIGRSSVQDDSDDGCRTGEDDEEEEQVNSDDEGCREEVPSKPFRTGSSRRKPQHVMSSSSRRKAAQPQQWVAPLDTSNYDFAEDEFDGDIGDRLADDINGSHDKRSLEGEELDDQKTDEEMEAVDETCGVESDSERASPPPYKKLKSTASVMSKLAINEDSSSMMQECVQ